MEKTVMAAAPDAMANRPKQKAVRAPATADAKAPATSASANDRNLVSPHDHLMM